MRISFLCSDEKHPVNAYLEKWIEQNCRDHEIELVRKKRSLSGGDLLFLISCSEIVTPVDRAQYRASLVIHASDLPKGKGWSPHVWQILDGAEEVVVSLVEAEDRVDSGRIWKKLSFFVPNHALWDEINAELFAAEIRLIDYAVNEFDQVTPVEQAADIQSTYYPRRKPEESQIDPSQTIASQFNKIRVCDPDRFPAFFELHGVKYKIYLEKMNDEQY